MEDPLKTLGRKEKGAQHLSFLSCCTDKKLHGIAKTAIPCDSLLY